MTDTSSTKKRVRFQECRVDPTDQGGFHASVDLTLGKETFSGTAERPAGDGADVWAAAEATLHALSQAMAFDPSTVILRDVTVFEIDESLAVATSLRATVGEERRRLFGLCRAEEDRGRAGALAVLSATNRFFSTDRQDRRLAPRS